MHRCHHRSPNRPRPGRRRRPAGRLLAVLGLLVVVLGSWAAPASAHASLVTTSPADDALLDEAPETITLTFTEGVAVQADGVRVLDANGDRVDAGEASASGSTVSAPLRSGIGDGGYVVAWRAVSEDGHPINGAFAFSVGVRTEVGSAVLDGAFAASADGRDEWAGRMLRALTYVAVLGVAGAVIVGFALRDDDDPSPITRPLGGLAAIGLLGAAAQLPFQASLVSGQGLGSVTDQAVLELVLADGFGWSLLLVCLGLLGVVLTTNLDVTPSVRWTATVGAVLAPLGLVVTGHTRTMTPAAVGYLADALHVMAGSLWFGGLFALAVVLRRRRRDDDLASAATAVRRFSGWAMLSVAGVVVSGLALTWVEVRGLDALTGTDYGRMLMAKVAVVGLVLIGAAWNRYAFIPSLDHDGDGVEAAAWPRFRTVLRLEVVGIVVVLGLTGILTNLTPARTAIEQVAGTPNGEAVLGDGRVQVVVDPGRAGRNDIHVYVLDEQGSPDDRYDGVEVELSLPAQDVGPIEVEPVKAGPGHYQVVNTDVPLPGAWDVMVRVRPDRFSEIVADVTVTVR